MNRLERISAILVQLQSRPIVTAQQVADRFDISLRTVYRDIKTLEEAGIPVIGNVGIGYSLIDGYKLPPLMFTREEAIAFLTAEKFIEHMSDSQNIMHYKMGMSKIKAVLKYVEKDYLTAMEDTIKVIEDKVSGNNLPPDIIQCILKSISDRKVMHIGYFTQQSQTYSQRDIEPVGCFYNRSFWYLLAYCRTKDDYRNFRIDRIKSFELKDATFSKAHLTLSEFMQKCKIQEHWTDAVIRINNADMPFISDYKSYYGCYKEEVTDVYTDLHFRIFDLDHFARWFISFADIAQILEPDSLKSKVKELYSKIKL